MDELRVTTGKNDDENDDIIALLDLLWILPGIIVSIAVMANWAKAAGIAPDQPIRGAGAVLLGLLVLFGPATLLGAIGGRLRKEALRGGMSWEAYWAILSGIVVGVFVFFGITGFDKVIEMLETLGWFEGD